MRTSSLPSLLFGPLWLSRQGSASRATHVLASIIPSSPTAPSVRWRMRMVSPSRKSLSSRSMDPLGRMVACFIATRRTPDKAVRNAPGKVADARQLGDANGAVDGHQPPGE